MDIAIDLQIDFQMAGLESMQYCVSLPLAGNQFDTLEKIRI